MRISIPVDELGLEPPRKLSFRNPGQKSYQKWAYDFEVAEIPQVIEQWERTIATLKAIQRG